MRHPSPLLIAFVLAVGLHAALLPLGVVLASRSPQPLGAVELDVEFGDVPESLGAGESLAVPFTVTSRGTRDAVGFEVRLYLSQDRAVDESDTVLFRSGEDQNTANGRLSAGAEAQFDLTPELSSVSGPWFLVAEADATDAPPATAARALWIDSAEPAQLVVNEIDAPPAAFAGGTLEVGHTLRNGGAGWARGGWTDEVWLSIDGQVSDDDLLLRRVPRRRPLGPGETLSVRPGEVRLPLGLTPGPYRLIVRPDRPGSAASDAPLNVRAATHPDLVVRNVETPSKIVLGESTPLRFDVVNRSPAAADVAESWTDAVVLSVDDVWSPDDQPLLDAPGVPDLPGNHRYRSGPHGVVVSPSQALSSQMFLLIVADAEGQLDEDGYEDNNVAAVPIELFDPADVEAPDETELGRDDEPARVTVAWIPHDAFEELRARQSVTHQPVVQEKAEPTPAAPLERDPEDAAQASAAPPTPPSPVIGSGLSPPAERVADTSRQSFEADAPGQLPAGNPGAVDQPGNAPVDAPGLPTPTPANDPPPEVPPPPTVTAEREGEKPTSAPRDEREADPTMLVQDATVRPGQVLVGPGLEVRTFSPRFSAAARASAVPRNPTAVITFDPDGTVLLAELTASSGFENVDAPVLSSLYRWKATGRRLEAMTAPFQIEITILLGEPVTPAAESDGDDADKP